MKMKRSILNLMLALCLALMLTPGYAAADETFSSDTPKAGGFITSDTTWTVDSGVTVTMNGTVTIKDGATLTLTGAGTFLRGARNTGILFDVSSSGTLIIDGVTIDGNNTQSSYCAVDVSGTCELRSGTIQNCSQPSHGAAIYVGNDGYFTMSGGKIQYNANTGLNNGEEFGGAGLYNTGTSMITGGELTDNRSHRGGAIYNTSKGKLTITGGYIHDNQSKYKLENGVSISRGNGIFHSCYQSTVTSELYIGGNADIRDDIYLDNTNANANRFVYLTSALQKPLKVTCGKTSEGRVIAKGSNGYTVTTQDMARFSITNGGWYFGLNVPSQSYGEIFLTDDSSKAYIPIEIGAPEQGQPKVELKKDGDTIELDYDNGAYKGNVKEGTYDVLVDGQDTGNTITVKKDGDHTFSADYLKKPYTITWTTGDTIGYMISGDRTAIGGTSKTYRLFIKPGYCKTQSFCVKVNETPVSLDSSDQFTIANITENKVITVEGIGIDNDKPTITGIVDGGTYCIMAVFTVTDANLDTVTDGTQILTPGSDGKTYTLTAAGEHTITAKDKAGNTTNMTITINASHTPAEDDGNCETPILCTVCRAVTTPAQTHIYASQYSSNDTQHWHACTNSGCVQTDTKVNHTPQNDDEDCTTALKCSSCDYVITPANSAHTWSNWASDGNDHHTHQCTVSGCKASGQEDCSGGSASYFKRAICSACTGEYGTLLNDATKPTGQIDIQKKQTNPLLRAMSFNQFVDSAQTVTITATDDSYTHDGYDPTQHQVKIAYLLSDTELTDAELPGKTFTGYAGAFDIDAERSYVIYARLTDHANNVAYLSSNGIVLDKTAPVIEGISDGESYCIEASFTVTDANLDTVTDGTKTLTPDTNGNYTLTAGTHTITSRDKAGNSTSMTITVYASHQTQDDGDCTTPIVCDRCHQETTAAQEHSFTHYVSNNDATCTADGTKTATCDHEGCTKTDTLADAGSAAGHRFSGGACGVCGETDPNYRNHDMNGGDSVWYMGDDKGLSIATPSAIGDVLRVMLDGRELIKGKDYVFQNGQLLIMPEVLQKLTVGLHPMIIYGEHGYTETAVIIERLPDLPKTGDSSMPALWYMLLLASAGCLSAMLLCRKRKAEK